MIFKIKEHIQKEFPYLAKSKLLVAISAGIDSVVLTHILNALNYQVALAHVNYQLRGIDSDKDEAFVKDFASDLQLPVFVHKIDTETYAVDKKVSIQMAARKIRYEWFAKLIQEKDYDFVVTAHHLDDVIETFFINLNRSSGLDGFTGIPQRNGQVIRPLLSFSREDLVAYATQNELNWREDASNATTKYLRNSIRHNLIPVLTAINPEFRKSFATSQQHLKDSQSLVQDYIAFLKPKILEMHDDLIYIKLDELMRLPNPKPVLYELLKGYGFTQWGDVYNLLNAQTGKQVFSNTHYLLKNRGNLLLGVIDRGDEKQEKRQVLDIFRVHNSEYKIETVEVDEFDSKIKNTTFIDKSKIKFPLFVRKWQEGDYFYPLGMQGKKKISDFLINQKIALIEKEKIWLLCDSDHQIIWVIGQRLDNRFKITENTTEILKITSIKTKE